MKKPFAMLVALAVVAGGLFVLVFEERSDPPESAGAVAGTASSAVQRAAPAPLAPGASSALQRPPPPNGRPALNDIVQGSRSFNDALARAKLAFGESDPRVSELQSMAQTICSQSPDPTDATDPRHPDNSRAWAVARLLELCEGFHAQALPAGGNDAQGLTQIYKNQGKQAAAHEASRLVRTANDYDSLYAAGQVLLETGSIPLDRILPGHQARYGPADLMPAWAMAVQLVGCAGALGCGPDSLPTATFCAAAGCVQGVTYEQALRQELPETQLRATIAFQQWILSQRRAAH